MEIVLNHMGLILGAIGAIILIGIIASGYVKASPNEALLISGVGKKPRTIIGKASIKIPFFEKLDKLDLSLLKIDVKTRESVPTKEFINVFVDAVVTVKISTSPELLQLASQNFLNKNTKYIADMVEDVLEGNIREIVGKMNLETMISDRQEFAKMVQENAVPDMQKMGLEIVSFNVQNFTDEHEVINNLGIDNTTKIQKTAQLTKIQSQKEVEIAKSEALKEANDAKVNAERDIAIKNNELALKNAELKKAQDTQKAIANSAYEIAEAEQDKVKQQKLVETLIAKEEKQIQLKEQETKVKEQSLEATIKKQAEADKYKEQQEIDVTLYKKQKEAEGKRYEQEQQAEAMIKLAEANLVTKKKEAEGIKVVGDAKAQANKAWGLSQAESELKMAEAIREKAKAQQEMGEASKLEMTLKVLPEVARALGEPLSKIDKITMFGEGNNAKLMSDIVKTMTQVTQGVEESTGISLGSMLSGLLGGKIAVSTVKPKEIDTSVQEASEE